MNEQKLILLNFQLDEKNKTIMQYEVAIENWTRSIDKINTYHADDVNMVRFKEHYQQQINQLMPELVTSRIMRDVITEQIAELQ